MVHRVVPLEKVDQETPGILHGPEPLRELRVVFQRLELALRIRVVIGDVRPAVGLGHPQVDGQKGHRHREHRPVPVRVDRQGSSLDALPHAGLIDQALAQGGRVPVRRHPADSRKNQDG